MNKENYEVVKFVDDGIELDVSISPKEDTVWLNQRQLSKLFETSSDNIGLHIKNILKDGELDNSTSEEFSVVQIEGNRKVNRKVKHYNLDMIISVGYRVNSKRGIIFRRWASNILRHIYAYAHGIEINSLTKLDKIKEDFKQCPMINMR